MDARKNFAFGTLASGITSGATSLDVGSGEGARFPAVPFNAVIWNRTDYISPGHAYHAGAGEIVRVTAIATDTLTITRAQESTAAVNHNTGGKTYEIWAGPTDGYWDQLYANGDVMTTRGDLIRRGASNPERVALGLFGTRLSSDSTDAAWYSQRNFLEWFDDFPISTGMLGWTNTANSGAFSGASGVDGHPGIVQLSTSGSSTAAPIQRFVTTVLTLGGGRITAEWAILIPVLSDGTETFEVKLGFGDSTTGADPANGVWLSYTHGVNSGQWVGKTSAASTPSSSNSTSAPSADTWYNVRVVVDGTTATFYVNDVLIATVSTNVPTLTVQPFIQIVKSVGTTTRTLRSDMFLMRQLLTTSR